MKPAIHLTEWRRAGIDDPAVVMIHGSAQGSIVGGDKHFSVQSGLAMRGWRIIVPDRPGHGRSPSPGRPDDPDLDAAWVCELLGEGAHLVGHSFGGAVALAAAAMTPGRVRSLTLIEPATQLIGMGDPRAQAWGRRIMETMATATSAGDLAAKFSKLVGIPDDIRGGSEPAELERIGRALAVLRLPTGAEISENLARIVAAGIAFQVVSGGWNPGIDAVSEITARQGGGRHMIVPSPHHFPQLVSEAFNDLLAEFMSAAVQ